MSGRGGTGGRLAPGPVTVLHRDRVTTTGYAMLGTWGWVIFCIGPVLPLLGQEMGLSNTLVGLHATGIALGGVAASTFTVPLLQRVRRDGAMVVGCLLLVLGAFMLVGGPMFDRWGLAVTLTATVVGGNLLIAGVTAALAGHHGPSSAAAVSEANGLASGVGLLAPLAVGAGVALGYGWRPGVLLVVPLSLVALLLLRRAFAAGHAGRLDVTALRAVPVTSRSATGGLVPLPRRVWVILAVVMTGVGMELSINTWSVQLLRERTALDDASASAAVATFALGMTVGRFAVVPVARRLSSNVLLQGAGALLALGWTLLWTATLASIGWVPVALLGLTLCGAGVGAFFPLGSAWLVRSTLGQAERGLARMSLGTGFAAGLVPFALGAAADVVGVHAAFVVVPLLLVVAVAALLLLASRAVHD